MPRRTLASALNDRVKQMAASPANGVSSGYTIIGVFLAAEPLDSNLSRVLLPGGQTAKWVPKLNVTGLAAGDSVYLQKTQTTGYVIIGKYTGNPLVADSSTIVPDTVPPSTPGTPSVGSPTLNSVTLSWSASTDDVALVGYDIYFSTGEYIDTTTATTYTVGSLSVNTSYSFKVRARDVAGNVSSFSGIGSGSTSDFPAPDPGDPVLYEVSWQASWSANYNYKGSSELDDWFGAQVNQGRSNGKNMLGLIGFDVAAIAAYASGYSVAGNAMITLTYGSWWNPTGGTAVVGTSTMTSAKPTYSGVTPGLVQVPNWGRGVRQAVNLGSSVCNGFLSGTLGSIALGPGTTTDVLYTGWAYGANTGINQPILTLQFWR